MWYLCVCDRNSKRWVILTRKNKHHHCRPGGITPFNPVLLLRLLRSIMPRVPEMSTAKGCCVCESVRLGVPGRFDVLLDSPPLLARPWMLSRRPILFLRPRYATEGFVNSGSESSATILSGPIPWNSLLYLNSGELGRPCVCPETTFSSRGVIGAK